MVQGQQQTNANSTNYLSNELLATTDPSRVQSEKVKLILLLSFKKKFISGNSRCTFSCSDIEN
jgi:hypothetical protein